MVQTSKGNYIGLSLSNKSMILVVSFETTCPYLDDSPLSNVFILC